NERAGRNALRALALATAIFVTGSAIAVLVLAWFSHAMWAAPAAIASLPATATIAAVRGYVTGIKRVRYLASISLTLALVTFALTAVGLFLIQRTPFVAIVAWVASLTLVAAVAWIAMMLHARTLERGQPVKLSGFLAMALKSGATALVSLLNYRADLYI